MAAIRERARQLLTDQEGTTTAEYAVLVSLLVVIAMWAISTLGSNLSTTMAKAAIAQAGPENPLQVVSVVTAPATQPTSL